MSGATAEVVVVADRVHTMGGDRDAQMVAIAGGRVIGTGPRDAIAGFAGEGTRILDAGSRTVIPGFVDVHAHAEVAARTAYTTVDVRVPTCRTIADVQAVLGDSLADAREGWLIGQANLFFDQKLADGRFPTRAELDEVSRDVAIAVRAGGHITILNSRALELAGIDRAYEPPSHSVSGKPIVEREASGEPSGIVKEMDNLLPFPEMDAGDLRDALRAGMRDLFTAYGVTAVGEISETVAGLRAMDDLHGERELAVRMFVYLWVPGTVSLDEACAWREGLAFRSPEELIRIQGLKVFADGGYSAASAVVKTDYVQRPGWRGAPALTREQVATVLERSREADLQLAIHANGDRTQELVCEAIAAAGGAPEGRIRTRIEHAGNFLPEPEETIAWWRRAGIIPVPQPAFIYAFGDYFPTYLGPYGAQGRFPFRDLLDDGWRLSGSCDIWVGGEALTTNPFFGIWCCRTRETFTGDVIDPDQAITIEEAMRFYTVDAAHVLGREGDLGSLRPGRLADLSIVDRDPFTCPDHDLRDIKVDAVLLGGELRHERDGAPPLQASAP
jgi:predicted amidohydrolase YtcJ